jgi:hypothetical protein
MAMLGAADVDFQDVVNDWLSQNPEVEIRHVTAFPNGEGGRWFQVLIFFSERVWNPMGRSANPDDALSGEEGFRS